MKIFLNKSSEYYYQIQGQLAITKLKYADFFIFTSAGIHNSQIEFDPDFRNETLENLDMFWKTYVAPELLFRNIFRMNQVDKMNIQVIQANNVIVTEKLNLEDIDLGELKAVSCSDEINVELV